MKPKFKIGDEVMVIKYGSLMWIHKNIDEFKFYDKFPILRENDDIKCTDVMPDLIGKTGIIDNVINTQGKDKYSISGIKEKSAWYNEDQLESTFIYHKTVKRGHRNLKDL